MISTTDVQALVTFDGGEHLVLSVYLNLEPVRQVRRSYRAAFEDLAKRLEPQMDARGREALDREAERVRGYLEAEPPEGKGLALFSCTPRRLWLPLHLPVAVADAAYLGRRPYLAPLLNVLDEYERYAVALIDKEKARLFTVYLGEIEEERQWADWVPGHHDEGGWSQANYQRHHEAHVYRHLQRVSDELSALLRRRPFDRLVLAGPEEAVGELRRRLPRPLRRRLVGTFPGEIFASEAEILERTLEIERGVERAEEESLVAAVAEAAASHGLAALGVAETLGAVQRGQVHKLVVADGLRVAGSECPACGRVAPDRPASCPICAAIPAPLDDVVERAIERTLEEGGTVEVVHGPPAERLRAKGDGLGAVLRFAIETTAASSTR